MSACSTEAEHPAESIALATPALAQEASFTGRAFINRVRYQTAPSLEVSSEFIDVCAPAVQVPQAVGALFAGLVAVACPRRAQGLGAGEALSANGSGTVTRTVTDGT